MNLKINVIMLMSRMGLHAIITHYEEIKNDMSVSWHQFRSQVSQQLSCNRVYNSTVDIWVYGTN